MPLLSCDGLAVGRAGGPTLLEDVSLALAPGECVMLCGATGAGKSTLLRALAGVHGADLRAGRVASGERVALMLQHVETQLLCTTVGEEVAFGLRHRGIADAERAPRVRRALADVGLAERAGDPVGTLSAGEQQRVLLAALFVLESRVLLLDEPTSALDAASRTRLAAILARHKARGAAILVADHEPLPDPGLIDRTLRIESGCVVEGAFPSIGALASEGPAPGAPFTVDARSLAALAPLRRGERVLVVGPNGSGKSSWLARTARELAPGRDTTRFATGYVMQEPRRQLGARSVGEEVAFALCRAHDSRAEMERRVRALLGASGLEDVADRSPLRLSFGQQHRLAFAAALAARPALLLVDEPFAGLDADARRALLRLLAAEQEAHGTAVVIASHDRSPLADWCHRCVGFDAIGGKRG